MTSDGFRIPRACDEGKFDMSDAVEKRSGEGGLPQPSKKLGKEASVVTVPEGDLGDPTDLDFDGEDWDEERDGPIPDYPEWRIAAELEQAVTTKDEEGE